MITLTRKDRMTTAVMRRMGAVHRTIFRLSAGRLGRRWFGGTILLLTVVGRKSGREFTVPLMYVRDGDDLIVAASNGGVDRDPQWWLNLRARQQADVEIRGQRFTVSAAEVDAAERAVLWDRLSLAYGGFEGYQAGVQRQIAVVRLRPR